MHFNGSFCGLPTTSVDNLPPETISAVIGVASSSGTPHDGAQNGPYFVRSLSKSLTWSAKSPSIVGIRDGRRLGDRVVDLGDVPDPGSDLDAVLSKVRELVAALPAGVAPAVIGGDHTISLPVVEALRSQRREPFCVLQFDHHLDLQIWGETHPAQAIREPIFNTNVMSHIADVLGPGQLFQIGVAPFATVETSSIRALGTYLRSVGQQVDLMAPELDDARVLGALVGENRDIYISVDLDVLCDHDMSSTGYPSAMGLSARELMRLIDAVARRNRIIGFDVVEFSAPRSARDPKTLSDAGRALDIFVHLLSRVNAQVEATASGDSATE